MTTEVDGGTISPTQARRELARFFVIADLTEEVPAMFSQYIDAEWHLFMESAGYAAFCGSTVGHRVGHDDTAGAGEVGWLADYHDRFGPLPAVWFADADGTVDETTYGRYLATRTVSASWKCQPTTNDPDISKRRI